MNIMNVLFNRLAVATLLLASVAPVSGQQTSPTHSDRVADLVRSYPGKAWPVLDSPQVAGWSNEKLKVARQYADSIGSAAVMIVQGGVVVDQWGDVAKKFNS